MAVVASGEKAILQALMIALFVIVRHIVRQRALERWSAEEDHPLGALRLHRAYEYDQESCTRKERIPEEPARSYGRDW